MKTNTRDRNQEVGSWLFDWGDDRVMAFEREHGCERQQKLSDLFKKDLTQGVGDFSSVVWHPSAGLDWSPLVFYSRGYLSQKECDQDLTPATFHVMTNLSGHDQELLEILESEERICYEDDRTLVRIAEYEHVELKERDLWARTQRENYHGPKRQDSFLSRGSDGFLATIELRDKESGYVERVPLLYLLSENHATYQHFVGSGLFQVRHLKVVCEGLAFGFCSRTLVETVRETGLGKETLETIWVRERDHARHPIGQEKGPATGARPFGEGQVAAALERLDEEWKEEARIQIGSMPLCFSGELARVVREDQA